MGWHEFSDAFLYYPGNGAGPCDHMDAIKEIGQYLAITKVPAQARAVLLAHLKSAKTCDAPHPHSNRHTTGMTVRIEA